MAANPAVSYTHGKASLHRHAGFEPSNGCRASGAVGSPAMKGTLAVTGDDAADHLVNTDPLALLLAMMLDQHMR